jgi:hyaluronan synthase
MSFDDVRASMRFRGCPKGYLSTRRLLLEYFRANADFYRKLATAVLLLVVVASTLTASFLSSLEDVRAELQSWWGGELLLFAGRVMLVIGTAEFAWRVILVFFYYKPDPASSDDDLCMCTVVVPAYNEGQQVLGTIRSLAASDYPRHKLEIIAVDDGSKDDTWQWILQGAKEFPDLVVPHKQPKNMGKREALHVGFLKGRGEVFVTVDSDSLVDPQTVRELVSPMVRDPRVGAVAGNVRVLNTEEGLIPRMLDVQFVYGFEFIRASQSAVETVFCTPGALSAYRRDVVMKVLDEWVHQTFMGNPANIGEDRAMTNLIIREGYFVRFQRSAVVYTNVPVGYRNLYKMLLRWGRSNVRETIAMFGFIFKNFRNEHTVGTRINFVLQTLDMILGPFFLLATLLLLLWRPEIFILATLAGAGIHSLIPAGYYYHRTKNTDGAYSIWYSIMYLVSLSWIAPWSMLTVHKSGWLTRSSTDKQNAMVVLDRQAPSPIAAKSPAAPTVADPVAVPA